MTTLADVIVSDSVDASGNSDVTTALNEAVLADKSPPASPAPVTPAPAVNVPEKFRGKSVEEIVEAYQNLESRYGAMANDLGVQRQLTDRLLDLKRDTDLRRNTPPAERKPVAVSTNDLLDKPTETLERVVDARATAITEDVNARLARMEQSLAQSTFVGRHPDYATVVNESEFKTWVQGSAIRMRAAAAAHQGNWQIADELLSEYKTSKASANGGTRKTDEGQQPTDNLSAARSASLTTSGTAGGDGKSSGGKIYRRADLMRLRIEDPERYYDEGYQAEILKAHAEGRVK